MSNSRNVRRALNQALKHANRYREDRKSHSIGAFVQTSSLLCFPVRKPGQGDSDVDQRSHYIELHTSSGHAGSHEGIEVNNSQQMDQMLVELAEQQV